MSYDSGLVARVADALLAMGERGVRRKNVFSGLGFLVGKSTFAIAWGEGLLVKVPPDEYAAARAEPGVTPFAPGGERPMGTWLVVPAELVADDPELATWVARGLRGIRTPAAPKPRSKATSKAKAKPAANPAPRAKTTPKAASKATSKAKPARKQPRG